MNSYPAELIQHHYACMLVSGLLPSQGQIPSSEANRSHQALVDEAGSSPAVSATGPSSQGSSSRAPTPSQAFPSVAKDLCDIFSARGRNSIWDPAKSQSEVFHTILVDNNVRLPPKKTRLTPRTLNATAAEQQSTLASLQPRSPLSPLHPSSPLFPDGLIAPVWIRKHRELVPSVFVSFYCLTEQVAERDEDLIRVISERKRTLSERGIKFTVVLLTTRSMLESPSLESRLSYIRRSSQLDSKASLFVLTPVSRAELGDFATSLQSALYESAQDYYREHYRRAKRKRSKYPPPATTISQIMTAASDIRGSPIKDTPLSKEGWLARNSYKLGTFAELMSRDTNDALGHYLGTYQVLVNELLASTMFLPPRTKRWAEAKVLSDCISFKICKIHLYRNDGDSAWEQFKIHIKRFTELSQGWGIGEMTFEYWSWLGKQYRLMGDLLDVATREVAGAPLPPLQLPIHLPMMPTFLLHPSHLPTPTANGLFPPSNNPQHGSLATPNDFALQSHVVPADVCPGAGACFYIAGICAMERWQRFKRMIWDEENDKSKKEEGAWSTLTQEKKIDHAAQAIEVFTKAHEVFKRQDLQRQSLLVASKIAYAYVEGNQYEMALRFLERIVKSYRADGWPVQVRSLLLLTLECARESKNVESQGRALWLLLSLKCDTVGAQREAALKALQEWQSLPLEEDSKTLTIESGGENGVLLVESTFAKSHVALDDQGVLFQIRCSSPGGLSLPGVHFEEMHVYFSDRVTPYVVHHEASDDAHQVSSTLLDVGTLFLGRIEESKTIGKADLRWWTRGTILALQGTVLPFKVGPLQVEKISLLGSGGTRFSLDFHLPREEDLRSAYIQKQWLVGVNPARHVTLPFQEDRDGVAIQKRQHKVTVNITHQTEAFLEEAFPITLVIRNEDAVALQCLVEVAMQGSPPDDATDRLWIMNKKAETMASRLEEVEVGVIETGATLSHTIFLSCQQHLRPRTVELVVKTVIQGDHTESRTSESFHTVTVPLKQLFNATFHAAWRAVNDSTLGLPLPDGASAIAGRKPSITVSDMDEKESNEGGGETTLLKHIERDAQTTTSSSIASVNASVAVLAKEEIFIRAVTLLLNKESRHLRIPTLGPDPNLQIERLNVSSSWMNGDRWGAVFDVEILNESITGFAIEGDDGVLRPTGQLEIQWRRNNDISTTGEETMNLSHVEVPLLAPPHLLPRIVVSVSSSTTFEQPLVMLLSIMNPSKLSSEVFVTMDDALSDFGILSHKSFTVPLMAKSTRSVPVHVLSKSVKGAAISQGIRHLPKLRAWQKDRRIKKERGAEENAGLSSLSSTTASSSPLPAPDVAATYTPIMNHQRGGGLPLEVQLRYSKSTSTSQQSSSSQANLINQLQAETQKSGAWTVYLYSQVETGQ
ncbi:hypothetical protein CBS101457_003875 [Exobasidium rhododendri]|nr:hypothetical protein CBS101457_003875 [Exobasidium rhododendri]